MRKIYLFLLLGLLLGSCAKHVDEDLSLPTSGANGLMLPKMPFADSSLLVQYASDEEIVPFTLSYVITSIELKRAEFFNNKEWQSAKLHNYPIVVYGFDDRPIWYDFILIDGKGKAVGTITSYARKKSAKQIRRASVDPYHYNTEGRAAYCDGFSNRYTSSLNQIVSGGNVATRSDGGLSMPANMTDEERLAWMRDVFLPAAIVDPVAVDSAYARMEREYLKEKAQSTAFWARLLPGGGNIADSMPLDENPPVDPNPVEPWPTYVSMMTLQYAANGKYAWLKEYQDTFLNYKYNRYGDWCGSWVAAFILAANGINLDPNNGQYFPQGLMTAPMLNFALKDNSGDVVYMGVEGIGISDAFWRMRDHKMGATRLFWCNGQLHWTGIYGSTREPGWLGIDFYYYFLEADNGSYINPNKEYRSLRDPANGANYSKATWEQSFFAIHDKTVQQ